VVRKGTIGPRIVDDINEALKELWMKELLNHNILLEIPSWKKCSKKKNTPSGKTTRD
jgi:hypothetical protein